MPAEAPTVKPSPDSESASWARADEVGAAVGGQQDAELVAAHPERGVAAADLREPRAEAAQQQVAGRVAEGVVVGLEAVEVEQREHGGLGLVGGEPALELGDQRAAVAQPGQRVAGRLVAARAQHPRVLAERPAEPHHDGEDAAGGRPHRALVEPLVVVGHQQPGRAQPGDQRDGEEAAVGNGPRVEPARALPRRRAHEHHARGPGGVEHAADLVGAVGDAPEVDRVRHPEQREAADDRRPGAPAAEPEDAEQAGDEAEQQDVAHRVGEVGGDRQRVAAGAVEHPAVDERGGDGGEAERDDQAVDPQHPRQPPGAAAGEQQQPDEAARVEAEVERVGERRIGDVVAERLERDRVVEVGGREADHPEPDHEPRLALLGMRDGAPQAAGGGDHLERLVQVLRPRRPLRPDAGVVQREDRHEHRGDREGQAGGMETGATHLPP